MAFVLTGTSHGSNARQFTFELAKGPLRSRVTVVADLALVHKYQIPLQELPLLCLQLVEACFDPQAEVLSFSEQAMSEYADRRAVAKADAEFRGRHRVPRT